MWSQKATSSVQATKRFTVIVPRRTPYDKHFQQRQGEQAARTVRLVEADIGTRSAIVLDGDEASAEGSEEQPEVIRDELSTAAVKAELFTTSANDFEAYVKAKSFHRQKLVLFRQRMGQTKRPPKSTSMTKRRIKQRKPSQILRKHFQRNLKQRWNQGPPIMLPLWVQCFR